MNVANIFWKEVETPFLILYKGPASFEVHLGDKEESFFTVLKKESPDQLKEVQIKRNESIFWWRTEKKTPLISKDDDQLVFLPKYIQFMS